MHEYWKKVHDEALAGMRRVTGQEFTQADFEEFFDQTLPGVSPSFIQ